MTEIGRLAALVAGIDVSSIDDDELARGVLDAEQLLNAASALSALLLEAFEHRGAWSDDGALSAARWAAARTGTSSVPCSAPKATFSMSVGSLSSGLSASAGRSRYGIAVASFPVVIVPPWWTDIHHCRPWQEGGATSIANGALLCRRHHTFIHKQHWDVRIEAGKAVIRKPDGSRRAIARWNAA